LIKIYDDKITFYNPGTLFCFSGIVIYWTHFSKLDMMNVLLFNLSILYILKSFESKPDFLIACFLSGLSISCKLPSVVLLNGLIVVFYFRYIIEKTRLLHHIIKAISFGILGLFIGDPWAIIDFKSCFQQIIITKDLFAHTVEQTMFDQIRFYADFLVENFSFMIIPILCTIPMSLTKKENKKEITILVIITSFILLMLSTNHSAGHWLLPILPSMIVLSLSNVKLIVKNIDNKYLYHLQKLIFSFLVFYTCMVGFDVLKKQFLLADSKKLAKNWIENNLPHETKIALDRGRYLSTFTANLVPSMKSIEYQLENDKNFDKDFLANNGNFFIEAKKYMPLGIKKFEIYPIIHGETDIRQKLRFRNNPISIDFLKENKIKYLLVSDGYYGRYFKNEHKNQSNSYYKKKLFYKTIFKELKIVKKWIGDGVNLRGPSLTLFRI
jgi:hypothetical protein